MIMNLISYFLGSLFISVATYYVAVKLTDRKFELFNLGIFKFILFEAFILMLLYVAAPSNVFRMVFNVVIMMTIYKFLLKLDTSASITISFLIFSIIILSEFLLIIILKRIIVIDFDLEKQKYFMNLITNISISIMIVLIININVVLKTFRNLFENLIIQNIVNIIFIILVFSLCLVLLIYYSFFGLLPINNFITILFLVLCYISFPIIILMEQNKKTKLKLEYETILKSLDDYENNLSEQRMKNHENQNILITIRGMLKDSSSDIYKFINQVLKDENEDDQNLLHKTMNIPTGGLQGLIYQKLLVMKNNNINTFVNVGNNVRRSLFQNLNIIEIKDICMIVGVFLDNAIQEVENNKDKMIGIQIYRNKKELIIEISNSYSGILEFQTFDKKGFTTKSYGHGYGLSLVKEIIAKNHKLSNIKEINGKMFSQKLIIKI